MQLRHASICTEARAGKTRRWVIDVTRRVVAEVPAAREDHRRATLVACGDHLGVPHRAAGLDECGHARLHGELWAVREGEGRVRGDDRAGERLTRVVPPRAAGLLDRA